MSIRDLQLARKESLKVKADTLRMFPATIVEVDGSTEQQGRANFVWVQENSEPANIVAVWNDQVASVAGLPVWVVESPSSKNRLEIAGINTEQLTYQQSEAGVFNLPLHAPNHVIRQETAGIDPVPIYQSATMHLKSFGDNALEVTVLEHYYIYQNQPFFYGGETIDLTTSVPVSGHRLVLLALDPVSNLIQVTEGLTVALAVPMPIPSLSKPLIPSSLITLVAGQTDISTFDDVRDIRDFLGRSSEIPDTTRDGEILVNNGNGVWEAGIWTVDNFGQLLVTSSGLPIVT